MNGAFNAPRHKRKPTINITSLIDVMFLLLIFFMVSSTFKEQLGIDIALPQAASAESQEVSTKEITVDRAGDYYFGQHPVTLGELRAALLEAIEEDPQVQLVLRADARADFGRVIRAIDVAREVGGRHLVIPTDVLEEPLAP